MLKPAPSFKIIIGSCVSLRVSRYIEAHGKFGVHGSGVRVSPGTGESCKSSLLNALQTIPCASYLDIHTAEA